MLDWFSTTSKNIGKAQNVVVVGSGPCAIEFSGEVKHYYPRKKVTIVNKNSRFLTNCRPKITEEFHNFILRSLNSANVNTMLGCSIATSDLDIFRTHKLSPSITLWSFAKGRHLSLSNGGSIPCDLLIFCTGSASNNLIYPPSWLSPRGKVKVNEFLQVAGHRHIYAVGDINSVQETKQAAAARKQGIIAAENIIASLCGERMKTYEPKGYTEIRLPLGPQSKYYWIL